MATDTRKWQVMKIDTSMYETLSPADLVALINKMNRNIESGRYAHDPGLNEYYIKTRDAVLEIMSLKDDKGEQRRAHNRSNNEADMNIALLFESDYIKSKLSDNFIRNGELEIAKAALDSGRKDMRVRIVDDMIDSIFDVY